MIEYFIFPGDVKIKKESHRRMFSPSFGLDRLGDDEEDGKEDLKDIL